LLFDVIEDDSIKPIYSHSEETDSSDSPKRGKGESKMRKIVTVLIICILCIPMFSVMVPKARADVEAGAYTNPVPPGYGFINFEEGTDGQVIRSTLPGLSFTTTLGYDWVCGDVRTGKYNARSLTDPSVDYGEYVVNGYFFAWLGPNMGEGRIDFVNGPASYLSVLTSTYSGLCINGYDSNNNLVATSGWAYGNLGTYAFTRLTVQAPNMAYIIIHDTGNYWEIDDLVTDAGGTPGLGPGPVHTCIQVFSSSLFICETSGQSADIVAMVTDQLGNPWSEVNVYFTTSGGVLSTTTANTDSQGKAAVTLSPGSLTSLFIATVTATANEASNSLFAIFYPLPTTPPPPSEVNWRTKGDVFDIRTMVIDLPNWLISTANWYNKIPFVQKINIDKLESLHMTVYGITKASSATQEEFTQALSSSFGITASAGYSPLSVLIIEFPYEQLINALFDKDYHEQINIPLPILPDQAIYFDNTYLKSTPSGSFDLSITFSKPSGVDAGTVIDLLSTLANSVTLLVKKVSSGQTFDIIEEAVRAVVAKVESIGDVDIGMITSDLDQLGQLSSYSIFDLKTALDRFEAGSCIVLKILDIIVNGLEGVGGILTAETGAGLAVALWAAKGAIATVLDLGLEILDVTPWADSFKDSWLYKTLEGAVSWVATRSDPEGTTIVPSVYDSSGSLVLGYNSTSADVIYASTVGILIPSAGDWLGLLHEDKDNLMNYTLVLNAVGGSAAVPYNLRILSPDLNAAAVGYCGMVLGGTSSTILVNLAPDGTLIQQVYLDPVLSVSQTGNILNVVATGLLSNGSLTPVTKTFLIVNGIQYEMTQVDSSTFEIQIVANLPGPIQLVVYMISLNIPGGFAVASMVDDTPPNTTLAIGNPKYLDPSDNVYVTSDTPFTLSAEDNVGGSGVATTGYRIRNATHDSGWIASAPPIEFYLTGLADGEYFIDYNSTDNVGNTEPTNTATVILDNTPPTTTLTIGEPKYISGTPYITSDTPFTLEAADTGSGVYSIAYRIYNTTYNSGWQTYTVPFKITSLTDGAYTIEYNGTDNVQNTETTHTTSVTLFHWNYIYQDTYGRGTALKISLAHKFFQFIAPSKDYGIRNATYMRQCGRAIIINHNDKQLRLITASVDTKTDFCFAMAWDIQTRKCYLLIDKAGIE